jgi:hypothetical protein
VGIIHIPRLDKNIPITWRIQIQYLMVDFGNLLDGLVGLITFGFINTSFSYHLVMQLPSLYMKAREKKNSVKKN